MLRRTLKVIAVSAAIVFVPYYYGLAMLWFMGRDEVGIPARFVYGLVFMILFAVLGFVVGMLLKYVRTGSIYDND